MAKQTIVTAPCVIARDGEGRDHYLYRGTQVPDNIPVDEVKRLGDLGVLGTEDSGTADAGPAFPEGEPTDSWTVPQLRAYAADRRIDLGEATRKGDVLAAVTGGQAPAGGSEPPSE